MTWRLAGLGAATLVAITSCEQGHRDASTEHGAGSSAPTTSRSTDTVSPGERTSTNDGRPVMGGVLVYGLEADTANPWAPYRASCSTSCRAVLKSISDPLFSEDPNGDPVPVLVESVEANAEHTEWTLHIRDGITFHDGTRLDGAAVEFNMESCQHSPLTAPALDAIGTIDSSGLIVTVTTKDGPWVALPAYFSDHSSCGFMFSPTWLRSLDDVPQRTEGSPVYDAALAATPASGDPASPVGLGAFQFESYTSGNGNSFNATRNSEYWRGPDGITGEALPYLDAIEFVVAVDEVSRSNAVRSGQFDLMMTANGDTIRGFLDDDRFKVDASTKFGDTNYILLNTAAGDLDPEGMNAASPLLEATCRRALAMAIDRNRYSDERSAGLAPPANGPFPPGSVGYLDDNGYPAFDVEGARAEMDNCLSAMAVERIELRFDNTNDPFNVESNSLIDSMWTDAFGDKVHTTITPIEQGQFIATALTGSFQALDLRNHNGSDPDEQRIWWTSATAAPIGQWGLNFGRLQDRAIDQAFDTIKSNPDPSARRAAAENVNRAFGARVWNIWLTWTLWGIVQQPYVNGVQDNVLPDGSQGIGLAYLGLHNLNQMWCSNRTCD